MRCDGRLKYAEFLPQDARFPIILPRKNCVTKLIVKHYHEKDNHPGGTNQLLAALSTRFWIISGREEIWEWEKECNECQSGPWWTIHHCAGKKDTSTETLLVFIYLLGNQSSPSGNGLCT